MNLTIIGGSGFVGKSFIDFFNRTLLKKYSIKSITIICRNKIFIPKKRHLNLKRIKIIYADISKIKKLPESDLFIYAAETSQASKYNNNKIIKSHKKGINNFCNLVKGFKKSKILYLSSGAVSHKNILYNPDTKYKKIYSKLKLYSETKIRSLNKFNIKCSIARLYTFIGSWLPIDQHYILGNFINDALNNRQIVIRSRNLVIRSYMYADDMVVWLITILLNVKKKCNIYNVGSDRQIEIRKLAKLTLKLSNKNKKIMTNPLDSNYIDKYIPNINKTKKEHKLKIKYSLAKALLLTIRNHK
tara:strand:+ start:34 stop:936 length:903 start_codon:yes stop_codon:yes gene_type:complete